MKELFKLFAEYNFQTNQTMIQILEKISSDQLTQDMGSYYHSILGLLNHLVLADISWINREVVFFPELEKIAASLPKIQPKTRLDIFWNDLGEIKSVRNKLDTLIKEMVGLVPEQKYTQRFTFKSRTGKEINRLGFHLFLHFFNHQTHHRGQIALLLDQLKVENDYSNIIALDY